MTTSANHIRTSVAKSYSKAIKAAEEEVVSCCAPSCCGGTETAEYDASVPSFGCGDPLLFANVEEGSTVLDLGSGAGYDLIAAASRVGAEGKVIGIDMTDDMIESARRNVAAAGLTNVEIRKGLIEDLPVESGSVDWVISNCVVNLSPEKDRVFAEIARVLKPGGRFSVSDICASDLPAWLLSNETAYAGCIAGAVSETSYVHGLRRAGLSELLIDQKMKYGPAELRSMVMDAELRSELVEDLDLDDLAGKIWTVRFTGRKPV
jgi:arsenite methyltransferase